MGAGAAGGGDGMTEAEAGRYWLRPRLGDRNRLKSYLWAGAKRRERGRERERGRLGQDV